MVKALVQIFDQHDPDLWLWRRNVGKLKLDEGTEAERWVAFSAAGQSDIEGIAQTVRCPICKSITGIGTHVEIECKRIGNDPTDLQADWLKKVEAHGGIAFVMKPDPERDLFGLRQRVLEMVNQPCGDCERKSKKQHEEAAKEKQGSLLNMTSLDDFRQMMKKGGAP